MIDSFASEPPEQKNVRFRSPGAISAILAESSITGGWA